VNSLNKIKKLIKKEKKYFNEEAINNLFDGDSKLFKKLISESKTYFEYGAGFSTIYASQYKELDIYSVDTNLGWINDIKKEVEKRVNFYHVDLGEIDRGGTPKTFSKLKNFNTYVNILYDLETNPDLILIDGRFRVNCLLTALRECEENTLVLFDDYKERPRYHIVEIFEKPIEYDGRQALFRVGKNYDINQLDEYIKKFEVFFD
jgi:hypothetical protein